MSVKRMVEGAGEDAWGGKDGYRRTLSGGKAGNLKGGGIWVGCGEQLRREEKIVLGWGRSEMVVNSCLEDVEGRMRLIDKNVEVDSTCGEK